MRLLCKVHVKIEATFLINDGAHMNILFIFKVEILELTRLSCTLSQVLVMLIVELGMINLGKLVVYLYEIHDNLYNPPKNIQ